MPLSDTQASSIDCRSGVGGRPAETTDGHVAEWLRSGLQNRLPRFNSGRGLHSQNQWLRRLSGTACRNWRRANFVIFAADLLAMGCYSALMFDLRMTRPYSSYCLRISASKSAPHIGSG